MYKDKKMNYIMYILKLKGWKGITSKAENAGLKHIKAVLDVSALL